MRVRDDYVSYLLRIDADRWRNDSAKGAWSFVMVAMSLHPRNTASHRGHDPLALERSPAAKAGLEGIVVRLDAGPRT